MEKHNKIACPGDRKSKEDKISKAHFERTMLTFREALNVYQIYQSETCVIKIILLQTVRDLSLIC